MSSEILVTLGMKTAKRMPTINVPTSTVIAG